MHEVCKMFGEEHPVSRERSLNHCVIVWWLDCLWLFREIMRTTVNFRQQKQKVTIGWQWMTMDRHSKTVQLCAPSQHPFSQTTHSTTPTATEASASKDDPESINAGAPNLSDRWLTSDHLHNGPALFEWKGLLWRVVSTCKQSKRRFEAGGTVLNHICTCRSEIPKNSSPYAELYFSNVRYILNGKNDAE